jgi:hypothetical protein
LWSEADSGQKCKILSKKITEGERDEGMISNPSIIQKKRKEEEEERRSSQCCPVSQRV